VLLFDCVCSSLFICVGVCGYVGMCWYVLVCVGFVNPTLLKWSDDGDKRTGKHISTFPFYF